MSSLPVQPPAPRRIPRLYVALVATLFAAGLAASLGAGSSVRVTVDGKTHRLESGTTIADIVQAGYVAGRPGNMLSATTHRVVASGGASIRVWRNGRPVTSDRIVYDGDTVTSADGTSVTEMVVEKRVPIPVSTQVVGSGPLVTLAAPGAVGVRQLSVGAVSGDVVTSTVLVKPSPMIVKRYGRQTHEKVVALTFDDGPWPGQTDKILHILRQYKVRGTFFMVGYLAKKNHSLAHKVAAEGHLVGNHTAGHRMLTRLSAASVDDQIERGERILARSTGETPAWFRPPGGDISPAVWARVRKARLKVALWSVDPQDWRKPGAKQIAHRVAINTRPGSIVLLHDGGGNRAQTIQALPVIIRSLQSRGYRFVTLDEMPVR